MADGCPDGWTHHTVRGLTSRHFSGPSPTCEERRLRTTREWGLLKTTAITWDGWDQSAHKVPPPAYWGSRHLEVRSGDVLITKAGPRHRVGVVVHVPRTEPHLMVSGKMVGLQPDTEKVIPSVLAGLLSTPHAQKYLDQRTTGMAESQVNFANSTLLSTPLCVPPPPEQQRIAEILDTLDEAIRRTEQIIAKLKQIKDGLLHDLLTRGIDDNGELRDPERRPEQVRETEIGLTPACWDVYPLVTVANVIDPNPSHRYPNEVEDGVPIVSTENFEGEDRYDLTKSKHVPYSVFAAQAARCNFTRDDVVFARKGRLGFARPYGIERKVFSHTIVIMKPRGSAITPRFLLWCLRADPFFDGIRARMNTNLGVPTLGVELLGSVPIPVPSEREQKAIARVLDAAAQSIEDEQEYVSKLRLLKHGLMEDLLTGRVRVNKLEAAA